MTDIDTTAPDPSAPVESAPVESHTPTPEAAPAPKMYDEAYVQELRQEAASRRVALKEYDENFGEGWTPEAKQEWLNIAKELSDPKLRPKAAERLKEVAQAIFDSQESGVATTPTGEIDPDQQPLTKAEFRAMQAQAAEEAALEAGIRGVEQEATSLGFPPVSEDGHPNPEYQMLLSFVQHPEAAGDLTKAKDLFETWVGEQASKRAQKVAEQGSRWPGGPESAPSPVADPDGGAPKNYRDARRGALAWLNAKAGE